MLPSPSPALRPYRESRDGGVLALRAARDAEQPVRHRHGRGLCPQPETEQRYESLRIAGPGSLQGTDAAEALIAAFSDPEMKNEDTYTVIPFQVTDAGSPTPLATAATTAPVEQTTQHAPLQYALFGAIVLIWGIALWNRC